jgi:hypothetical protein
MKNVFFVLVITVIVCKSQAQTCTGEDLSRIPGSWKPSPLLKGSNTHLPELEAREKDICDRILEFVRLNFKYVPMGGDIFYNNVYNLDAYNSPKSGRLKKTGYAYEAAFRFLGFTCNNGRLENMPGSLIQMHVTMNNIPFPLTRSFFVSSMDKNGNRLEQDPETDTYGFSAVLPDGKARYLDYTDDKIEGNGADETHQVDQYRMLYKPGKPPFIMISKKEYYEKWKKYYLQQMQQKETVIDANSAEMKQMAGGDKMIAQEKKMARTDDVFVNKIKGILRSKSAAELARPAIAGEEQGAYFEQIIPNSDHAAYIIKANPAYHNPALPLYAPQVITIHLNYFKRKRSNEGGWNYHAEAVYKELERIKIMDLLAEKLQPMIAQ